MRIHGRNKHNMKKLNDKHLVAALTFLLASVYFVSYLTRKNFSAVISEYVVAEGVTKSAASVVTVAMFVCYGAGQLISGWLGDKVKPEGVILAGLSSTVLLNLIVPFVGADTTLLAVVWGLNGVAQAMLWPPMVRIASELLSSRDYQSACVSISVGGSIGTITVYLISSLFVKISSWKTVFFFSAACGFAMAVIWTFALGKIRRKAVATGEETVTMKPGNADGKKSGSIFSYLLILIMIVIICQGMLRDGVETWMPSYLHDVFGLDTSSSILTSVGLPIFSILSIKAASFLYSRVFKSEMRCAFAIFGAGLVFALLLGIFCDLNVVLSSLLVVLITGAMHGVNLILTCYVSAEYGKYGKVSFISGLLNSCTYVGSAIFTYGIAKLADLFDWRMTIFSWAVVALIGTVCCLVTLPGWKKFTGK